MSKNTMHVINHPAYEEKRNKQIYAEHEKRKNLGEEKIAFKLAIKYDLSPARIYQIIKRTKEILNADK